RLERADPLAEKARGARGLRRGGLPIQQAALREDEPHESQRDRVRHLPGVVRQEDEREKGLREGRAEVLEKATQMDAGRLVRGRPLQRMEERGQERKADDRESEKRPDERAPGQEGEGRREESEERRRDEATPEV